MRYRPVAVAVAVLVTLVACGGSESGGGDPRGAPGPSADERDAGAEFVRRVDAVCKDTNPELAAIQAGLSRARDAARAGRAAVPKTFEAFATLLRRAAAATQRLRTRLRAIEAPRGEAAFYEALIDSVDKGAFNLRRQVSAAEARDAFALRRLSVEGSVLNARGKGLIAGHGGFRFCGRG